ncbi:MAG: 4-hydroxyphenylacetate 3-hydroxylase N-terminal domain-containing protein [Candidatus Freyarchaeum deiterrae]
MVLRTVEEYLRALRDGREVWIVGEKVEDVTTHPMMKVGVETAAIDYKMAEDPKYRDLAVAENPETGEPISRHYLIPRNAEDLLKRHELIITATRLGDGIIPFTKDVAGDSLNAVTITNELMKNEEYIERITEYYEHVRTKDLSVACAMTDVKGDRSLHPSSPDQTHPDFYVHVVDKNDEGITVRGAKIHITGAAYSDEILILPCRAMRKDDSDYAVAFAVPANAKGLKQICHPLRYQQSPLEFPVDMPIRAHTESMIVFDDVFVPWERVFLCGEWQYAGAMAYNFSYSHRHTAACYRIAMTEILLGLAVAIAEYNGIDQISHVREKMTDLIIYLETLNSLARASCSDPVMHGGLAIPNPTISNLAKYHFAENYHKFVKDIEDLCGGIYTTAPTYQDYQNPDIRDYIEKYLGGKKGLPTEDRLKIVQALRIGLTSDVEVLALHAEGSLQAQRMVIYGESLNKLQEYKETAKRIAGIK